MCRRKGPRILTVPSHDLDGESAVPDTALPSQQALPRISVLIPMEPGLFLFGQQTARYKEGTIEPALRRTSRGPVGEKR